MTIQPVEPQPLPVAGWYPDSQSAGVERWWDGAQWTMQVRAIPAAVPVYVANPASYMVTTSKRHTSHTFHLIMTILTAGLWGLFVWLPMTILNNLHKEKSRTRIS